MAQTAKGAPDGAKVVRETPFLNYVGLRHLPTTDPEVHSVEMPLAAGLFNPIGLPHGGAVATLVDHAGGFALALRGRAGPTTDLHVRYLAAPRGELLRADAHVVRAGRRLAVVEIRVVDSENRLVAIATMTVAPIGEEPTTTRAD